MVDIFLPLVCNSIVIHYECKRYVPGSVFEQAVRMSGWDITVFLEVCEEVFICYFAGLPEPVSCSVDPCVHVPVNYKFI